MNRSLFRVTAYLQLGITILLGTGCAQTQPFFANESPDLQHYLNTATQIEYPDVQVDSLPDATQTLPPLTANNHNYQFWDLTLEQCVSQALQNARFIRSTSGLADTRGNFSEQFIAGTSDQFTSVYDIAIQQSTTQSIPLTIDGNGNRILPRGVLRANQIGGVEDALAEFDAQASAFIDYQKGDRPNNVLPGNVFNPVIAQSDSVTQQSAISKRFATGGVATFRQQILYSRNNTLAPSIARAVPSDWTAVLEAQIQHPLMRNRGTLVNRIPVVLASLNEDIAIADFELQVRNLVADVQNAYWDLYVAYRAFSSTAIGRNSAQVTADFAKENLNQGIGTDQDLQQARGQYFSFQRQLTGALSGSNVIGQDRFGVYGRERALRELLGIAPTDGRLIRPVDEPTIARVEHDFYESLATARYLSPELRKTKIRIKQSELELMSAKNQIMPELNLSFTGRVVGVGDDLGPPGRRSQNFPAEGSSALGELTEGNYVEGGVRLEFTPTAIGSRRELTRINGSEFRFHREKVLLQEQELAYASVLTTAYAKISTHYQQIKEASAEWQAYEQEVESRLAALKNGRGDTNVVLQSQQRRADAQIAYYRAVGEYNKSLNYLDFLQGTLLVNSGITLAEGPWNDKAYQDALERARERSAGYELQYGVTRPSVVRTGPVRDADHAIHADSDHAGGSIGSTLPPVPVADGINGSILDAPISMDQLSQPLTEMGDSPNDVLNSPSLMGQPVDRSVLEPVAPSDVPIMEAPIGSGMPAIPADDSVDTLPAPTQEVRQMTYQWEGSREANRRSAKRHQSSDSGVAPQPVKRVPLPN